MPPKTASNSLKDCLNQAGVEFEQMIKYNLPDIHLFLSEIVKIYEVDDLSSYKIIQIVRNPYDRFASSYFHQLRILQNIETNLDGLDFREFALHLKDCMLSDKDFLQRFYGRTDFIDKFVFSGKSWAGTRLYLNQHQWTDMDANTKFFKLEDISENINPLSEYLNLELNSLPKKNTNKSEKKYKELLTKEINEIVELIFKKDLEYFNY
jgi:hypothetical protein